MSLFGTSPQGESPSIAQSRNSLFDEDGPTTRSTSDTLFDDNDMLGSGRHSPWDMPIPRKQQSRADLIHGLLAAVPVPDIYVEAFNHALRDEGTGGTRVSSAGVTKTLAAAALGADDQAKITSVFAPSGEDLQLDRGSFNVLLALIGLAQEGEVVSLDGVDERRRSKSAIRYRLLFHLGL